MKGKYYPSIDNPESLYPTCQCGHVDWEQADYEEYDEVEKI